MNEQIRKLLNEATSGLEPDISPQRTVTLNEMEKFAELIVQECVEQIYPDWIKQGETRAETPLGFAVKRVKEHFGVEE